MPAAPNAPASSVGYAPIPPVGSRSPAMTRTGPTIAARCRTAGATTPNRSSRYPRSAGCRAHIGSAIYLSLVGVALSQSYGVRAGSNAG